MRNLQSERMAEQRRHREPVGDAADKPCLEAAAQQLHRRIVGEKQRDQEPERHDR
ncbi:hypothetical protein D3C71_2140460 [compost metagenome]